MQRLLLAKKTRPCGPGRGLQQGPHLRCGRENL